VWVGLGCRIQGRGARSSVWYGGEYMLPVFQNQIFRFIVLKLRFPSTFAGSISVQKPEWRCGVN